ncbi:hypothetical protein HMPREF2996_02405 [Corynebacterium sp. HMSC066C02]|uniref:hypothetical protein n=1 Tax=Corynebacterium sp. HMSC066C02 TaxID=1739500 RepID=UPI0008A4994E|nr:hypothetical protein [Corynebacterium sp. HMSC066C02]OFP21969.1 hypothetical protein HMPREF2996_02405 [Corynebacterium sp. HMSC066C02]
MSRCRVFKAYRAWHVYEPGPKRYESFPTWAKAMEYADRYSRLAPDITIEDPSGAFCDLTATNKREYIHLKSGGDTFNLAPHEWKPLAGFLLDIANRQEHHER